MFQTTRTMDPMIRKLRKTAVISATSAAVVVTVVTLMLVAQLPAHVRTFSIATAMIRHGSASGLQERRCFCCSGGPSTLDNNNVLISSSSRPNHSGILMTTALSMSQRRGLEVRTTGGATPSEGSMTLYLKAGPDGTSVGDCPFAHFVRMVLEEKGLEYELRPCGSNEDKPAWLLEHYDGSLPALRHRKECYIESDVIAQYLDFFFQEPPLALPRKKLIKEAEGAVEGMFPAMGKYLKHVAAVDDSEEQKLKGDLVGKLRKLERYLSIKGEGCPRTGHYLVGDGEQFTLLDCSLAPRLYHLKVGLETFKEGSGAIDIATDLPNIKNYMDAVFARPSFIKTTYPTETVVWGWENERRQQ